MAGYRAALRVVATAVEAVTMAAVRVVVVEAMAAVTKGAEVRVAVRVAVKKEGASLVAANLVAGSATAREEVAKRVESKVGAQVVEARAASRVATAAVGAGTWLRQRLALPPWNQYGGPGRWRNAQNDQVLVAPQ